MGIDTWIALGGFTFTIVMTLIMLTVTWTKQASNIDAVKVYAKNEVDLVKQDLENHKQNHTKLEARVTTHEDKIDDKLSELDKKIDEKHTIVNDKLDDLKSLIIERLK